MAIKNFSFKQIEEKANEIRKILILWQEESTELELEEYRIFLREHKFAPLIGTICDEQINADDAWKFPHWLYVEMKKDGMEFGIKDLLKQNFRNHLQKYLEGKWPKRMDAQSRERYLNKISRFLQDALKYFDSIDKNPVNLFENRPYSALEVYFTLRVIPGIGAKKANMLVRDFINDSRSEKFESDWFYQIKKENPLFKVTNENLLDMPIDVHVVKVFNRLFGRQFADWRQELLAHVQDIIAFSKVVNPEFPAQLDAIFWNIGKYYCHDYEPKCQECCLRIVCEVGKKQSAKYNENSKTSRLVPYDKDQS
ncbi:MAG: hypothetical protein QXJ53_00115 [Candidatus Bathyarchaeia archaeon]